MSTAGLIPVAAPRSDTLRHETAIREAMGRVLTSGTYILGAEEQAFEQEFANWLGVAYCCGVASGTDALALALRSCGVQPGDEVITVSLTAVATVAAIEQIGAVPVFSDVEPVTRCLDPALLPALITARTRAIIPVHLYGQPAAMADIMSFATEQGLKVIEDCAQAHGAAIDGQPVGSFGHAAAFSFYPTKNLGAIGDGGAVVSNQEQIYQTCLALRQYGWQERFISALPGINSRLDELQAAVLRIKLPFLDQDNQRRRDIAALYREAIHGSSITAPAETQGIRHAMHLFVAECEKRDELRSFLQKRGIATALHYPQPVHQQPAYLGRIRGGDRLAVTESLSKRIVTLPLFPSIGDDAVATICAALREWGGQGR